MSETHDTKRTQCPREKQEDDGSQLVSNDLATMLSRKSAVFKSDITCKYSL
jgi:hypothetical protein